MEQPPQQAGPLPSKRGEIGYQGGLEEDSSSAPDEVSPLPARHPADRDLDTPNTSTGESVSISPDTPSTAPPLQGTLNDSSSTHSGNSSILSFFKHKKFPTYYGLRLTSWIILLTHILILLGTVTVWILSAKEINKKSNEQSQQGQASSAVFIHIVFGIFVTGQVLFLERRIFRVRAERYMYLHRDEMLPTHNQNGNAFIGFAPWNRPPLPSYAAALAQSGVGTGDVEDHLIAAPPPPAYGNTRGSRLLLAGFLRESLRAQRPQSQMSQLSERPLSYVSRDEGWEEIRDADRTRRLEETLATLENHPPSRS